CYFYIHSYFSLELLRALRYLHSFPTRRSSDLAVFNVLCQKGDLISVPAGSRHWFDAGESDPFVKAIRIFIDTSGWVPHYTGSDIDRKSTRLNSSHVKISYAVFCLKKKKIFNKK